MYVNLAGQGITFTSLSANISILCVLHTMLARINSFKNMCAFKSKFWCTQRHRNTSCGETNVFA